MKLSPDPRPITFPDVLGVVLIITLLALLVGMVVFPKSIEWDETLSGPDAGKISQ